MKIPNFQTHNKLVQKIQKYLDSQFIHHVKNFEQELKEVLIYNRIPFGAEKSGTNKFKLVFNFSSDHPKLNSENRHQKFQICSNGKYILLEKYIEDDVNSMLKDPVLVPFMIARWKNTQSFEKGFVKAVEDYFVFRATQKVLKKKRL